MRKLAIAAALARMAASQRCLVMGVVPTGKSGVGIRAGTEFQRPTAGTGCALTHQPYACSQKRVLPGMPRRSGNEPALHSLQTLRVVCKRSVGTKFLSNQFSAFLAEI